MTDAQPAPDDTPTEEGIVIFPDDLDVWVRLGNTAYRIRPDTDLSTIPKRERALIETLLDDAIDTLQGATTADTGRCAERLYEPDSTSPQECIREVGHDGAHRSIDGRAW